MSAVAGLVPAPRSASHRISMVVLFGALPLIGLGVAVPAAWGWGLGWRDVGIAAVMYTICVFGIGVGFHRLFTHRAFKASRPLRIALAAAGRGAAPGESIDLDGGPFPRRFPIALGTS